MSRIEEDTPISGVAEIDPTVETFSKLPHESLRALYYRLGGTDDISNLRTRCALLKKIYEAMGNDPADLNHLHRARSVLQKISEVASAGGNGGKYVGVDISDAQPLDPTSLSKKTNPLVLSLRATSEINAIMDAGKNPIFEANSESFVESILGFENCSGYGFSAGMVFGEQGWQTESVFRFSSDNDVFVGPVYIRSSDYTPKSGGGTPK